MSHSVAVIELESRQRLGHTFGMTGIEKIAISIPQTLMQRVRRAVARGDAASVSAYFAAAAEEKSKHDDVRHLLGEMLAETGGPLTEDERREADRLLGLDNGAGERQPEPAAASARRRRGARATTRGNRRP